MADPARAAGFYGTRATLLADINLTAALVLLAGLIAGWVSANTMLLFVVVGGLGVGTYYVWYVAPAAGTGAVEVQPVEVAEAASVRAPIVNFVFNPPDLVIPVGTSVEDEFYRHVDAALASAQAGDLTSVRRHAEHMVIVLTGEGQDLDGDGVFFTYNGFGLLRFAQLASTHARNATQAPDANDNVTFHGIHVINSAEDILTWGGQALEVARGMAGVTEAATAQAQTAELLRLAGFMLNGVDRDGDGVIAPIPGEAGAYTALHHAQFMTAMGVVSEEEVEQIAPDHVRQPVVVSGQVRVGDAVLAAAQRFQIPVR